MTKIEYQSFRTLTVQVAAMWLCYNAKEILNSELYHEDVLCRRHYTNQPLYFHPRVVAPGLCRPGVTGYAGIGSVASLRRRLLVCEFDPPAMQFPGTDTKLQFRNPLRHCAM